MWLCPTWRLCFSGECPSWEPCLTTLRLDRFQLTSAISSTEPCTQIPSRAWERGFLQVCACKICTEIFQKSSVIGTCRMAGACMMFMFRSASVFKNRCFVSRMVRSQARCLIPLIRQMLISNKPIVLTLNHGLSG